MSRALPIGLVSLAGLVLFMWPFVGSGFPADTPAWALALACVIALLLVEAGTRQLDSRAVALLAAIAAIDTALRLALIEGIGGFSPIFAVGWVGVAAGLAGHWSRDSRIPGWRDVIVLATVGGLMGWIVGALLDVTDWIPVYRGNLSLGWLPGMDPATALVHFARFYLLTSLAYDSFRAVGNVLMVAMLGAPVLAALVRLRLRLTFEVLGAAP